MSDWRRLSDDQLFDEIHESMPGSGYEDRSDELQDEFQRRLGQRTNAVRCLRQAIKPMPPGARIGWVRDALRALGEEIE